jgi:transcriptional regulator with PAS, ATPase and Fis domain
MPGVRDDSTVTLAEPLRTDDLCLLVGVDGAFVTHPLPQGGEVTIGRAEGNSIRIDHPSISRQHARLQITPALEVEDLGSANGVRIRDRLLAPRCAAPLGIGDVFELGACLLQLRRGPPLAMPRPVNEPTSSMRVLHALADQVAASTISVLILGETGVGKEVLARTLHRLSPRAAGTLLALHCAALPESLLESELFGHEKGAFTGATGAKLGLLESADGGTVFLDEVGELPLTIQVKLLRVLEERAILRIGALRPRPIDVRFVAATNRDLETEVEHGRFRGDLYFRLNGVTLVVPPLRERVDEIGELAAHFIREACARDQRPSAPALSPEALERLRGYRWPGNVRELRNVIDRAVLLCRDGVIRVSDLPADKLGAAVERTPPPPAPAPDATSELHSDIQALERQRITEALERCAGNQKLAAKQLGISRNTLSARMDAFGFPRPRKSGRT